MMLLWAMGFIAGSAVTAGIDYAKEGKRSMAIWALGAGLLCGALGLFLAASLPPYSSYQLEGGVR